MKTLKKILAISLFLGLLLFVTPTVKSYNLIPYLDTNGNYLTYTGTSTKVMLPDTYEQQDTYFRGIWVTPKDGSCIGNIKVGSGKTLEQEINEYKAEVIQIFDVMDYYHLNALIFHIRIDNDALYPSTMNPWSDWFTTYGVNPGWDPLAWVIDECHKRGYEFHAWMNPYRIKAASDKTVAELATMIRSYTPNNIGADASNILPEKDGGAILNPGIPAVRKFIVDTCMEVIRNYDVDAIHFDDYFYSDMGAAGALTGSNSILTEPDQATYLKYKPENYDANSGTDKANWRRTQVDLFIEDLHNMMKMYNESTGRQVQLGISPSGVWRSGDGKVTYDVDGNAITSGSNTRTTFEHYGSYLFSDTLKWINEEWIDYILPQMYWGFTHTTAAFADLCDWWAKVVKNKDVILYSGMGIYMAETPGTNYSWGKDYKEAYNQILYSTRLKAVQGTVFYNYTYLKNSYLGDESSLYGRGMKLIKDEMFTNPAILPEITSMPAIQLPDVSNLEVVKTSKGNRITFDAVTDAKSYIVYRGETPMTFGTKQVFQILGPNATNGKIEFVDTNAGNEQYVYGVKVMSRTNSLSSGVDFGMLEFNVTFTDEAGNLLTTVQVPYGNEAVAPTAPTKPDASFIGWSRDITAVKSDLTVSAKYSDSKFTVTFYGLDNTVLKTEPVDFHGSATAPSPHQQGYMFTSWSIPFTDVMYDLDVYATYEINIYKVIFNDYNGTMLSEIEVEYLQDAVAPAVPKRTGYTFIGWDQDITAIKENMTVTAIYEAETFTVTFINDFDDSIISTSTVAYGTTLVYPEAPEVRGYNFSRWNVQDVVVYTDRMIYAIYSIGEYQVTFIDWDYTILKEMTILYEEEVVAPAVPKRTGYTFIGWDQDITAIKENMTVTAIYEAETFTVTFINDFDDSIISTSTVAYGTTLVYPEAPEVRGYNFSRWNVQDVVVYTDRMIYAIYSIGEYQVTFIDWDYTILKEMTILYEEEVVAPAVPKRTGYTFIGWDQDITAIKENMTVTAIYEAETFTVTFINDFDDSIISTSTVAYGTTLVYPEAPEVRGYNFSRWNVQDVVVYTDRMIYAIYSIGEYQVTFIDWDYTILKEMTILYEEEVVAPANPVRPYHDFIGWDQEFDDVAEDMTIKAIYKPYTYIVKFFGPNNELLHEEEVIHGEAALGFEVSVKGYTFVSWDTDYSEVTEDLMIYGTFEAVKTGCNSLNVINVLGLLSAGLVIFFFRKRFII